MSFEYLTRIIYLRPTVIVLQWGNRESLECNSMMQKGHLLRIWCYTLKGRIDQCIASWSHGNQIQSLASGFRKHFVLYNACSFRVRKAIDQLL